MEPPLLKRGKTFKERTPESTPRVPDDDTGLRVERMIDDKATTPTWGFRSDTILPGTDYRFTLARGLFDRQLSANRGAPSLYGIDPIQFYGELYLPQVGRGLDVKVGRFFAQ